MSKYELIQPTQDLYLGGSFQIAYYSQISGSDYAAQDIYDRHVGKTGIWYVGQKPNRGYKIYYHNPRDKDSRGFAGRVLTFVCSDGQSYDCKGPWHSNADALFADTGIALGNEFITWGCIGLQRTYKPTNSGSSIEYINDLIYFDTEPHEGMHSRVEYYARYLSKLYDEPLMVYSATIGGSIHGAADHTLKDPDGKFRTPRSYAEMEELIRNRPPMTIEQFYMHPEFVAKFAARQWFTYPLAEYIEEFGTPT